MIGTACTRANERVAAANVLSTLAPMGLAECATTRFEAGRDVQMAGLLAGLPALCAKMIAYRAETALVTILRRHLRNEDEVRALVRELLVASGDIEPDNVAKTLTVRIHGMANPAHDKAVAALLRELTGQEFRHPETGAKMIYTLV